MNFINRLWRKISQDPLLLALLVMAAGYFFLYYLADPIRPSGLLPTWLGGPSYSYTTTTGWYTLWDQSQYLRMANTLAHFHFHNFSSVYTYGLGYPLVAVPAIWLGFASDPFVFFNLGAFLFAVYAVYKTARHVISPFAGFLSGFGLIFATPLIHYTDQPWNSSVCLVAMSVILLTLTVKTITKKRALLLGLILGWVLAARYIDIIFLGALAVACIYRGSLKALYKPIIYMAVGASIIVIPVLITHYIAFGSPLSTPYVNHLGVGGVGGSDQSLQAYSLRRVPRAGLALLVSSRLAGSNDGYHSLLIDFFWALAAIPGVYLLIKRGSHKYFYYALVAVGILASLFYLSFRASTAISLRYGELHYFKMFWPCLVLLASAFFDKLYNLAQKNKAQKRA